MRTKRFYWISNPAENEWYLVDTVPGTHILFMLTHYVTKFRAAIANNTMGMHIEHQWEVIEYGPGQFKMIEEGKVIKTFDEVNRYTVKSRKHGKLRIEKRMSKLFGEDWREI